MVMQSNQSTTPGVLTVHEVHTGYGVDTTYSVADVRHTRNFNALQSVRGRRSEMHPHAYLKTEVFAYPYHGKTDTSTSTTTSYVEWSGRVLRGSGPTTLPPDHPSYTANASTSGSIVDDAMESVYEKLRGSANLTVDLAESRETKAMLRNFVLAAKRINLYRKNPSELVRDVLASTKGGPSKWPSQVATTAANNWMLYRYGIMPLVYSTYDILKTHVLSPLDGLTLVKGRSKQKESAQDVLDISDGLSVSIREDVENRCQVTAYFRMDGKKTVYDWASLDPARIAWELFPLSFVGDWFVNVSQVLELIENRRIYADRFVSGAVTVTTKRMTVQSETQKALPGYPIYSYTCGRATRSVSLTRTVLEALPYPNVPSVQVKLNNKRFTDAAALIYQSIKSKR